MEKNELSCVDCAIRACRGKGGKHPDFCLSAGLDPALREEARALLLGKEHVMVINSARTEADDYGRRSRVEEVMHLAQLMGAKKLGIATCTGLLVESRHLAQILRAQGYTVYGVACKCGELPKRELGAPAECDTAGKMACNPILQALLLNRAGTELNIVMGLCVGHDSLFYRYSQAYATTLVAKDRLLGHNTVAPLNQLDTFWRRLLEKDPFLQAPEAF